MATKILIIVLWAIVSALALIFLHGSRRCSYGRGRKIGYPYPRKDDRIDD